MSSAPLRSSGIGAMENVVWSPAEKAIARKAFERALQRELEDVMIEAKKKAAEINQASDLWELEKYLADCRTDADRRFDYRYSVLIFVFGNLIRRGRLREEELQV